MNRKEQKRLAAHFAAMKSLQDRIAATDKVLRGIQDRIRRYPGQPLRVSVSVGGRQYRDYGTYATLPADLIGPAFVPVLRAKLKELRQELRELPAVGSREERP